LGIYKLVVKSMQYFLKEICQSILIFFKKYLNNFKIFSHMQEKKKIFFLIFFTQLDRVDLIGLT